MKAGLYIVSTPIGNMADITQRAIDTLKLSDYIFAEDTRVTKKLLDKHNIETKLKIYNDHSDEVVRGYIKSLIDEGLVVSLVSDAGTPLISDPGYKLVRDLQNDGYFVDVIPGCCSPIAALTLSGLPTDRFMFCGFLPKTFQAKEKAFKEISSLPATIIFFETTARLHSSLEVALRTLGDREICVVREITKMYQTAKRGLISEVMAFFEANPPRGEIVIVLSGEKAEGNIDICAMARDLLDGGMSAKTVAEIIHEKDLGYSKSEIYKIVNQAKKGT
ncbi:MAG: 16S rRNA (cytidine(1402)-2'-O)-methyltransferase [Pseudomonadota bacterium]